MHHSKPKFDLAIASPCTQPWSEMTGTATKRRCESCQKQVHNFAAMTPRQIDRTIADSEGHLCARITRRADGSLVTAQELEASSFSARAATFLLGAALSTAAAQAQSYPNEGKAIVSGRFTAFATRNGEPIPSQAYVVFVADGRSQLEIKPDPDGNWKAEIAPGTYDVVFRTGAIYAKRISSVQLHVGEQEFAAVRVDVTSSRSETFTTMGDVRTTYRYRISYLFKHPIRYLKNLPHNFS